MQSPATGISKGGLRVESPDEINFYERKNTLTLALLYKPDYWNLKILVLSSHETKLYIIKKCKAVN